MSLSESDDEEETVLQSVSNYHFEDDQKEPLSFSVLPIQWSQNESLEETKIDVFLIGTTDGGLLKIHKPVTAWKFDISNVGNPEISVLTKENVWLSLQKPRKSFEPLIRTILITVQCLHFVGRNPDLSEKSLWDQLRRTFSSYEVKPSLNDLIDHLGMISEAVKRDASLSKSKFLLKFLEEKPKKKKSFDEDAKSMDMSGFIVEDEDDIVIETEEVESDEDEDDPFDTVCAFCDNGGELLCCEGKCLRSFHPTVEDGAVEDGEDCESLGLSQQQVSDMQSFLCKNCQYKQYQCFACGKLGAFDRPSGSEVLRCVNATCGHFYHPHCVATLLHDGDKTFADDLARKIAAGESFACPIHKCCVCKQVEDKKITELQFAVCRRCPKSYHRKCLPREILFDYEVDGDGIARAWNDLLPNRALIYCLEHEIDEDLRTPIRDHIRFPDTEDKVSAEEREKSKASVLPLSREKVMLKKRSLEKGEYSLGRTAMKAPNVKEGQIIKKSEKVISGPESIRRVKGTRIIKKPSKGSAKTVSVEVDKSCLTGERKTSLGEKLFEYMNEGPECLKHGKQDTSESHPKKKVLVKSTSKKFSSETPLLDSGSEKRLLALIQEAASSITWEEINNKHKAPSTHSSSLKSLVERITMGKIDGFTEAAQTAIKKLEKDSTIEEAKTVCGPDILGQIFKWQNKLKVYLSPFLYGMRYSSFGRHFTKVGKLEEIVDKVHCYVEDGDMIVDFCCGANDFSVLMSRKLEGEGKKCSYKNYDIMPPKNYFNFERRDWLTVKENELTDGSKLVMGLNPPFGVKAALANKFINKALAFKPKLIILIVPPETERLDKKKTPYELVWEDGNFLSGKSFYLPGSVDENDKAMDQWNVMAPPLYLWSRRDWAAKHKAIAKKNGHLSMQLKNPCPAKISPELLQMKNNGENSTPPSVMNPKERSPHKSTEREDQDCQVHAKNPTDNTVGTKGIGMEKPGGETDRKSPVAGLNQAGEMSRKRQHSEEIHGRGTEKKLPAYESNQSSDTPRKKRHGKQNHGKGNDGRSPGHCPSGSIPPVEKRQELPRRSPSILRPSRSPTEGARSNSVGKASHAGVGENRNQHFEHTAPSPHLSHAHHGTSYGDRGSHGMNRNGSYSLETQTPNLYGVQSHGYGPYNGLERESNVHAHVRLYGQDPDVSAQRSYMAGHNPGYGQMRSLSSPSYGAFSSMPEPSYGMSASPVRHVSAMQRYAPRLDELNYTMGNSAPRPPMLNGYYDPRVLQLDPRAPQPGYRPNSMGFAPGPRHPYSNHHSAGWLNE